MATIRVCNIAGCNQKHYGRGYCRPHYTEFRREFVWRNECYADDCSRERASRGLCSIHYRRLLRAEAKRATA